MILGIAILLLVLVITTWLFVMYATYKTEQGTNPDLTSDSILDAYRKIERLVRRGYYLVLMYMRDSLSWSNKKVANGMVKVIPSSAMAFEEKDQLTGLKSGPLSFYLKSISEDKKKKRLSPAKKMI